MSKDYGIHPLARLFPAMSDDEYRHLRDDIRGHGLLQPITILDGQILDGVHRNRACRDIGVDAETKPFTGDDPLAFVMSLNLKRRHLTKSQRAMIAVEALPEFETEAKKRQQEHGGTSPGKGKNTQGKNSLSVPRKATDDAAKAFEVNPRYIQDAKRIKEHSPALADDVRSGNKTLAQAMHTVTAATKQAQPLPTDTYTVIYADPPWKYRDSKQIGELAHHYASAERHYPTLALEELCELRDESGRSVKGLAADNSVLFLWATTPMMEDAFKVIRAWGFTYKSFIVWDKERRNFGHYVSVSHENLLIAVRGSCTPQTKKLHNSVQRIKRSAKHSEKPEEFRHIIDSMYPCGKRIELFARKNTPGWEAWGNEETLKADRR